MDYRGMSRLAQDPAAVRAEAHRIRLVLGSLATSAENDFLARLEKFNGPEPISMRQREFLYSLQQRISRRPTMHGFRASALIEKLWSLRDDLSEDAEEFIRDLRKLGDGVAPSINQWRYIFSLCHRVHILEDYIDVH